MKKILSLVIVILLTSVGFISNIIAEEPTSKQIIYVDDDGSESDWTELEVSMPKSKNKLDWPYYECIIWGRIRNAKQETIPPYGKVLRLYAKAVLVIGINIGFGGGIVNERYRWKEIIVPYKDFKGIVTDRRIIGQFDSGWIPKETPT